MKRTVVAILFILLMLCLFARADTYCDTSGRINYFYQLDGGKTDEEGTYDKLLVPVIRDITGGAHTSIVPKDNKYLTGRGCDLFSYGHAYQYLLGYAGSTQAKANILGIYLRGKSGQSHTWSSSAISTLNPPNACSLYAATLDAQTGVSKYSGSTGTFSGLTKLFNGCRGLCIVNAPGHYIIAVGCTVHDGVEYVLIVDSIMSATLRDSRCGYGYSFDFSTRYDQSNARFIEADIHQYWMPYSTFKAKCTIKYSFYVGSEPKSYSIDSPYRNAAVVPVGGSLDLAVTESVVSGGTFHFCSENTDIARVDESGIITGIHAGETVVTCYNDSACYSDGEPFAVLSVPVYVCEFVEPGSVYLMDSGIYPDIASGCFLPDCVRYDWDEDGSVIVGDCYGNVFFTSFYRLMNQDAAYLRIPASVEIVEEEAFALVPVSYILADNPDVIISPDAFDGSPELLYSIGNGWYESR